MTGTFGEIERCRYSYDPLDQQTACVLDNQGISHWFYCDNRLVTELDREIKVGTFRWDDQPLAHYQWLDTKLETSLLAFDQKMSVTNVLGPTNTAQACAYSPYGHHQPGNALFSIPGFNGERRDPVTGCYHLGNGYRQFNPLLMRFHSPDNMSPFGRGGLNAYAYCEGEPILRSDPDGHFFKALYNFSRSYIVKPLLNRFTSRQSSSAVAKRLRSAHVVRLDGQAIKIPKSWPDVPHGSKQFTRGVEVSSKDYVKLNKIKLKVDRGAVKLERENARAMKAQNWDPWIEGAYKYQSHYAKGDTKRQFLNSIERLDVAVLKNNMLFVRNQ